MGSTSYSVDMVDLLADIKVGVYFILTTIPQLILLDEELNPVDNTTIEILSSGIRMQPKNQGNKKVTISFANKTLTLQRNKQLLQIIKTLY